VAAAAFAASFALPVVVFKRWSAALLSKDARGEIRNQDDCE